MWKTSWLAERALGVVTTRLGLAVRVKTTDFQEVVRLVQPENYTKFLGDFWDVSGLPLTRGPAAVTDFLCWLESEPGCESFGAADEHKTATRIRLTSDQAYCREESKTKPRDSKMGDSFRSEENWERCSLPTDLGSSGRIASTAKKLRKAEDKDCQQRRWEHPSRAKQ